jgi:hypothetical protein
MTAPAPVLALHLNEMLLVRRGSTGIPIATPECVTLLNALPSPAHGEAAGVQIARQVAALNEATRNGQ